MNSQGPMHKVVWSPPVDWIQVRTLFALGFLVFNGCLFIASCFTINLYQHQTTCFSTSNKEYQHEVSAMAASQYIIVEILVLL